MFSLIVPLRDWDMARIRACLASFSAVDPDLLSERIIVDFGSRQPILPADIEGQPSVRIVRVEASRWSLGEAINIGVLAARTEGLVKVDADILLDAGSAPALEAALRRVASGEIGLLVTQVLDISPLETSRLLADPGRPVDRAETSRRPRWGQGGVTAFLRTTWDEIGGLEARYLEWGNEDNDFAERIRRAGHRLAWTDRDTPACYHLAHAPRYVDPQVARQRQLNNRLSQSDRSVLRPVRFPTTGGAGLAHPALHTRPRPLVTLAIATAARPGRDRMIREAMQSFSGQIDGDFEFAIVDNGSDDTAHAELKATLETITIAPIRLERQAEPSIPKARNAIADMARGRYLCVVDDDDIALPHRLADHLKCFEADGMLHGSHGGWIDFDEESGEIERNPGKARTAATLLFGTGKITAHPASLFRTDVARAIPYDESFGLGSDLDLAIRMALMGLSIEHTGSYLVLRRFHSSNVTFSGSANQIQGGARTRLRAGQWISPRQQQSLRAKLPTLDAEITCRRNLPLAELLALLPPYAGVWRLTLPLTGLMPIAAAAEPAPEGGPENGSRPLADPVPDLQALNSVLGGDVAALSNGINPALIWLSEPITGAGAALGRLEEAFAAGFTCGVISDAQWRRDHAGPIDWVALAAEEPKGAILASLPYADALDALADLHLLAGSGDLLAETVRLAADLSGDQPAYHLVTRPLTTEAAIEGFRLSARRRARLRFPAEYGAPAAAPLDRRH